MCDPILWLKCISLDTILCPSFCTASAFECFFSFYNQLYETQNILGMLRLGTIYFFITYLLTLVSPTTVCIHIYF